MNDTAPTHPIIVTEMLSAAYPNGMRMSVFSVQRGN